MKAITNNYAKKLTFILVLLLCNPYIKAHENNDIKVKPYFISKELSKAFVGLTGTALFGYFCYATATNDMLENPNILEQIDIWIHANIYNKFLSPEHNRIHKFIAENCIPIVTACASYESAKYTLSKIKRILRHKKLAIKDCAH